MLKGAGRPSFQAGHTGSFPISALLFEEITALSAGISQQAENPMTTTRRVPTARDARVTGRRPRPAWAALRCSRSRGRTGQQVQVGPEVGKMWQVDRAYAVVRCQQDPPHVVVADVS